jgi:hypothetical protein
VTVEPPRGFSAAVCIARLITLLDSTTTEIR